jgi:prepilin peptidase CpaA
MRGGAGLPAAIMLQSGPWTLAVWIVADWRGAVWTFAPAIFATIFIPIFVSWIPALLLALCAGVLDWRYRRIPNWLTVSGMAAGIAVNTAMYRGPGLKSALLGALLGLGVLLPFVLVRSLGAGDWKLAGALGACLGPRQLLSVLMGTILVAGIMALGVVIWTGRLKRTLLNIVHLLAALLSLRMPGHEVSLDDPKSTKIPFGVAMALTVVVYGVGRAMGKI